MAFKFRFETVLKQRRIEERMARKDYADAQAKVDEALRALDKMYEQIEQARDRSRKHLELGGACSTQLVSLEEFVVGQKVRVQSQRQVAQQLMAVAEEKRDILVEKAQEVKAIEKLKENHLEDWKLAQSKRELKRADEMATMRFKWRRSS